MVNGDIYVCIRVAQNRSNISDPFRFRIWHYNGLTEFKTKNSDRLC